MRLFDRFRSKKKSALNMEEAKKLEIQVLGTRENEVLEFAHNASINLCDELAELKDLLHALSKKEITEERVKNQKAIVDRYVAISNEQIKHIQLPEKSIDDVKAFIKKCEDLVEQMARVSPREALRMKFFFEEDFSKISQKLKNVENTIRSVREKFSLVDKHYDLRNLDKEEGALNVKTRSLDDKIDTEKNKLEALSKTLKENELQRLKTQNEISRFEEQEKLLDHKRARLSQLRQDTDNYLSIYRLLKKYKHDRFAEDVLLEQYIQSPSSALIKDEKLRIFDIITEALTLPIEDKKLFAKAKSIERKKLLQLRADMIKIMQTEEKERKEVEEKLEPLKNERSKIDDKIKYTQKELQETEALVTQLEKEKIDCVGKKKKIGDARKRSMQDLIGAEING